MIQNTLLNGDCLDVLPQLPAHSADLVLTDPPYLVNYKDRSGRSIANDVRDDWLEPAFSEISRVLRPNSLCVSFYGWTRVDKFMNAWCIGERALFSKASSAAARACASALI